MILQIGQFNTLQVEDQNETSFILSEGVILPKDRFSQSVRIGDTLTVFLYHNTNMELVATLVKPKGVVGDLVTLKVKDINVSGAFLDWGLPKDLFVPRSFHEDDLQKGDQCLVKILIDDQNGRIYAKEKLEDELSNDVLTVKEKDVVDLIVYKNTDLGYQVIINNTHLGLIHYNEVFKDLYAGDRLTGFIKRIKPDNKIDVVPGKPGFTRVETEADIVLKLLKEHKGFMPFHDKSPAGDVYKTFGMSKKTFKMTLGALYKQRKITLEPEGFRLVEKSK